MAKVRKVRIDEVYLPVQAFIKIGRKENEYRERAMLILRADDGREFTLMWEDIHDYLRDLTVCDMPGKEVEQNNSHALD